MYSKLNKKYYLIFFIIFFFHITYGKKQEVKKQDQLYFDAIKNNYSYDPETKQWSPVEKFNTIEIIENTAEKKNKAPNDDEDKILYENFWMYNPDINKWVKKDIPIYGYSGIKNSHFFLNKISLDLSFGPGITYYNNYIKDIKLIQRADESIFYIKSKAKNIYKLDWFESLLKTLDRKDINKTNRKKNIKTMNSPTFHGGGFSIPISIIAYGNIYTKVRLGGGITGEISWIKKLQLIDNEKNFSAFTTAGKQYFYNIKYFVLLGYKFRQKEKYNWVVEGTIGSCQDLGSIPHRVWEMKYIRQTLYYSLGLRTEKKFKKNKKIFSCLTLEWKQYVDTINKNFAIYLKQPALYLAVGIGTNFNT